MKFIKTLKSSDYYINQQGVNIIHNTTTDEVLCSYIYGDMEVEEDFNGWDDDFYRNMTSAQLFNYHAFPEKKKSLNFEK